MSLTNVRVDVVYSVCWQAKQFIKYSPWLCEYCQCIISMKKKISWNKVYRMGTVHTTCLYACQQENVGAGNDPKIFCAEIQNGILFIFPLAYNSNYALYPDSGYHRPQIIMLLIRLLPCLEQAKQSQWPQTILIGEGEICFRCVSLLMEDKWLLTMVTIRLLSWARPTLEEWSSNRFTEMNGSCHQQLSSSSD